MKKTNKNKASEAEPIRKLDDIKAIKKLLNDNSRNLLLFTLGINNGLRISDILNLKVHQLKNLKPGEYINIQEIKTGKKNIVYVNKEVFKAFNNFLKDENPEDDFFIFKSRQGYNKPISKQRAWQLIKDWTGSINLKGNYGTHTLRKTFGYIQRTHFGVSWEILCKRYNHSNPAVTMRYLGITGDEVTNILQNEI